MTLSVIVVNWNVANLLRDSLRSVYREMLMPPEEWELIVVDNHSSDGSVDIIRKEFPAVQLLANSENVGFGRANNQALPLCRGKYILLLNPDTVIMDHAIDGMIAIMRERTDVAALGCRLLNTDGSFQRFTGGNAPTLFNVASHFLLAYKVFPHRLLPRPLYLETEPTSDAEVGWVSGACMLLRQEALNGSLFDERFFMYCEDLNLCSRLIDSGWKVVYTPRIQIVHHDGRSLERQTSTVKLSKLRSLREAFAIRNGRRTLLWYDLAVFIGFLMRYVLNNCANQKLQAQQSQLYLQEACRTLIRRS